ncbi:MAG: RNA polymerase sigma factor [Planctomycetia bacterium]
MAPTRSEVDRILVLLEQGDSSAADELFSRFAAQLCRLVHAKLGWRYRRKFDAEDVAQSIFKSFLGLQARKELSFENWDALWGLLSLIAIRKCGHRVEYLRAACRDVAREHSVILGDTDTERSRADLEALSREPTPSAAAMLSESLERLMEPLDERERLIVTLALQGFEPVEISDRVSRSTRTVQRVLEKVRNQLERSVEGDS